MFIRCVFNNIYSFGKETELNMFPAPRFTRLKHHRLRGAGIEVLKLASIYGANGAGKSNLIRALALLQTIVVSGQLPSSLALARMKHFHDRETPTMLAIEFIIEENAYLYALEIGDATVEREELYLSGLGKRADELVYERSTTKNGAVTLRFFDAFMHSDEGRVLKSILEKNLIKPTMTALKVLADLGNPELLHMARAYEWFVKKFHIVTPSMKPFGLAHLIDTNPQFHQYAEETMCSFDVGIKKLRTTRKSIEEFFGEDNRQDMERIVKEIGAQPNSMMGLYNDEGEEFVVVQEGERMVVKQLQTMHESKDGNLVTFAISEESDGTRRLMEYLLAFKSIVSSDVTYFIDEMERSIHPLLIKEIMRKFSEDVTSKGQLIFTTHESNLLDQEIFRQDEIWFAEKDRIGSTDLYSLCEFKEHNTKDIQKGYLTGRYGSIPFLANLKDLHWDLYDFTEQTV